MDEDTPEMKGRQHDSRPNARIWCAETPAMPEQVGEMDEDTRKFLAKQLPDISAKEIEEYFGGLFGKTKLGPDQIKKERDAEISVIDNALYELGCLASDERGVKVARACKDISDDAKKNAGVTGDGETRFPSAHQVIRLLNEYRNLSVKWNELNPRTKGLNVHANMLADTVAHIFQEIGAPVTSGTKQQRTSDTKHDTVPSTAFGKVVKYAFLYHKIGASWIRPVERSSASIAKNRKVNRN